MGSWIFGRRALRGSFNHLFKHSVHHIIRAAILWILQIIDAVNVTVLHEFRALLHRERYIYSFAP